MKNLSNNKKNLNNLSSMFKLQPTQLNKIFGGDDPIEPPPPPPPPPGIK